LLRLDKLILPGIGMTIAMLVVYLVITRRYYVKHEILR